MTNVHPLREDGIALPLTVFLVAVLTILLTASFSRISNEVQLADGSNDMVTAFSVAQSGLNTYIGMNRDVRPVDNDSIRVNTVGGFADVVARLVRNDTLSSEWTYLVRSTGRVVDPTVGPEPRATHTVTQFAEWQWADLATPGALTSIGQLLKSSDLPANVDVDAFISGIDACGQTATIAGIQTHSMPDTSVGITAVGDPASVVHGSSSSVSALAGIDWPAILAGGIIADHDSLVPNDTTYKTYWINGELRPTDVQGTGLLIVADRLLTEGRYFIWDGVVLVGGVLWPRATDSTVIRGIVISGLNWQTGSSLTYGLLEEEPISVYYDSCKIKRSVQSIGGFLPIQNGWFDHWTTY